ncbi:MAG: 4-phosphoerythronate dehydrogenase [Sedimentisphaerales bacterium]|nr:4-phosphoerythronate dehydrogenase [Sedimentisphaerales bacterium]
MKIIADQNIPFVKECFSSIGDVTLCAGREIAPAAVEDADILLIRSVTNVNAALLDKSRVKFVATATIGTDHIDADYLQKRGIGFAAAQGSNANSVAEYIVAALLTIAEKNRITLAGTSLGIVGVGSVGRRVAQKAGALGMKLFLNDPPLRRQTNDPRYLPLQDIYNCDFITFHTPLTTTGQDKTYHLANEQFFNSLKNGAVFLNTSRGSVVDETALKTAITVRKLDNTVLDVWENEPKIDVTLLKMVDIATPHIAGYSYDGKLAGMIMIYEAACNFFKIKPLHTINDFLPPPPVPSIELNAPLNDPQADISHLIKRIYDIEADDKRTREILKTAPENHGRFFDTLRKDYPIRREFQNTVISTANTAIARSLAGIGFNIKS